jgi:hypothetical protein
MKPKNVILGLLCVLALLPETRAQSLKAFGVRTQMNYGASQVKRIINSNGVDYTYATKEADVGLSFGVFTRLKVARLFLQPEFLVSDYNTVMKLSSINFDSIINLKQNRVDIPLLVGYSTRDRLRLYGGPVYTKLLEHNITSDEFLFRDIFNLTTGGHWGFSAGFGFDMGQLTLDVRYETSLSRFGDSFQFRSQEFNFDQRNNVVQVCLGWDFIHR